MGNESHEGAKNYDALIFCSATVAANRITPPVQYEGIVADYRATFVKAKSLTSTFRWRRIRSSSTNCKSATRRRRIQRTKPFIAPGEFAPFIAKAEADFEKTLKERTTAAKP